MNGYLLDTNIALFSVGAPARLSARMLEAIQSGPITLSVVSYWEVVIKSAKGNLDVGNPRLWWAEALDRLGARKLALEPAHIAALQELPPIHADPFDRALLAQAMAEGMTLLTSDGVFQRYASSRLRILL